MNARDRYKLSLALRRMANIISLPAHPNTWPAWMTPEKRKEMVEHAVEYAAIVEPSRQH